MAYIERFKVKGNYYYKLVHAVRKGKSITHKIKYLGKILPPKERLKKIEAEFLSELKGKKYRYLSSDDVEKIETKKNKYSDETKKLSSIEREKKLEEFIIRFTYDSSRLSGVKITLRQTSLILREGVMPEGFKNLRTVKKIENHEKGIIAITKYRGKLDIRFIKKLHKILMAGVEDSIAGKLRSELQRDVKLAGTPYVPPKWEDLDKEILNFFKWYFAENRKLHALELASLIHLKMISLQPFVDGNSRLSRLLMNWVLWKKGYPPIDIPIEDIEKYYSALDKYQIEKNEKPFVCYIKEKYFKGIK
ncbi:Fic family protein [Candidatus Woesearchaeota archaeon]|nr:Fic family protein [Candidatus Woesearchaeota archaeon]